MSDKQRGSNGRFLSGNNQGTKSRRGPTAPKAVLDRALDDSDVVKLLQQGMRAALAGDKEWAALLIGRIVPAPRSLSPKVAFNLDLSDSGTAVRSILQALADGILSSEQTKELVAAVASMAQISEISELREQVAAIQRSLSVRAVR